MGSVDEVVYEGYLLFFALHLSCEFNIDLYGNASSINRHHKGGWQVEIEHAISNFSISALANTEEMGRKCNSA